MNQDNEYSIEVENLTKRYGDLAAVDNISFNVKKGEVFAIEPFLTLGDAAGYVVEAPQETIYSVIGRKRTGTRDADELVEKIWSMRKTLPFTPRWFARDYPGEKMRQLLGELKRRKLVRGYVTLVEASSRPVAQFEHTVALGDDTLTVLT
jgi:methionine aminopeptidase